MCRKKRPCATSDFVSFCIYEVTLIDGVGFDGEEFIDDEFRLIYGIFLYLIRLYVEFAMLIFY